MDQQLGCPHCRQIVAVASVATVQQAQCPYCQGVFMVPAANTEQPVLSSPQITTGSAANRASASTSKAALSPQQMKYAVAAALMLTMTALPLIGYSVMRWLSPPAQVAQPTAEASQAAISGGSSPVVVSDTVVKHEPTVNRPDEGSRVSPAKAPLKSKPTQNVAQVADVPAPQPPVQPRHRDQAAPAASDNQKLPSQPLAAAASAAPANTTSLIQEIEPSVVVVQVTLEGGSGIGSGFPLDDQGTIVTNYHVIEGAKSAKIKFGKKTVEVEGFLVFSPGKDIAILKAKLGAEKVAPLKLAKATPAKGESVLTFGAPQGFDSTVSNGIVSSLRKGTELQEIFKNMTGEDIYVDQQHYDLDAVWVQTTAPISGGNSGGPLVNLRGEVVGLNTWALTRGQNMNFAISADHIKQMMVSTSSVHPLAELPPPREHQVASGSGSRTLEYWEQVSKINRGLINRLKTIRQPAIPKTKGQLLALFPKLAGIYKKLGELLPDTAAKLKALKIDDVDTELVALVTVDALSLEKIGEAAREMSVSAKNLSLERVVLYDSEKLGKKAYGEFEKLEIGQAYDVVRIRLTNRYGETFASIFDTSSRAKGAAKSTGDDTAGADDGSAEADAAKREKEAGGKLRTAKSLKDAGKTEAARTRLQQIVDDYAGTKAAEEAQKLLDELEES